MIVDSEVLLVAGQDFGESAVFLTVDEQTTSTITGIFEFGSLTENQSGIEVLDYRPHFTTEASGAASFGEGDSFRLASETQRRTILDAFEERGIYTFVLDKVAYAVEGEPLLDDQGEQLLDDQGNPILAL